VKRVFLWSNDKLVSFIIFQHSTMQRERCVNGSLLTNLRDHICLLQRWVCCLDYVLSDLMGPTLFTLVNE
jgi:hypothetical protein